MLVIETFVSDIQETFLEGEEIRGPLPLSLQGEALETLLKAHQSRIRSLCLRFTANPADAEDLAQETFLRAYRGLAGFRGESRLSTWLYRIAVNVCLNWLATKKSRTESLMEGLDLEDPGPGPAERLAGRQRAAAVQKAVARLPERQRMTLVLRVYQELSHREISEIMGGSVGTAKANLFFALKNLKKLLGDEP